MGAAGARRGTKRATKENEDTLAGPSKKTRRDEVEESTLDPPSLPTDISSSGRSKDKRAAATSSGSKTTSNSHAGAETSPTSTRQEESKKPNAKRKPTAKPNVARVRRSPSLSPGLATSSSTPSAEPEPNVQEPSTSIYTRLDPQLRERHTTLLAHLEARRSRIMEEDDRRRTAFQEATSALTKEINIEERWLAELRQMLSESFPPLNSASPSHPPALPLSVLSLPSSSGQSRQSASLSSQSSHVGNDNERERSYLCSVIRHQDKHVSALYCAGRMAVERETTDSRLVAQALTQVEYHRQEIMLYRSLDS